MATHKLTEKGFSFVVVGGNGDGNGNGEEDLTSLLIYVAVPMFAGLVAVASSK